MAYSESILAEHVWDLMAVPGPRARGGAADVSLHAAVRKGLPFASAKAVLQHLALPPSAMATLFGIPARTMARRQAEKILHPDESDRLYRVARLVALAETVLGDAAKAREWLTTANRALAGENPLSLLDTEIGVRRVEEILERINYGILS